MTNSKQIHTQANKDTYQFNLKTIMVCLELHHKFSLTLILNLEHDIIVNIISINFNVNKYFFCFHCSVDLEINTLYYVSI